MNTKSNKIYILGNLPIEINHKTTKHYFEAENILKKIGFEVVNPAYEILNRYNRSYTRKQNLHDISSCKYVFIMPNYNYDIYPNDELSLIMKLNITRIQFM